MFGESWTTSLNSWYTIVCRGVCLFFQIFWTLPENVYQLFPDRHGLDVCKCCKRGGWDGKVKIYNRTPTRIVKVPFISIYILINVIQFLYLLYVCCQYHVSRMQSVCQQVAQVIYKFPFEMNDTFNVGALNIFAGFLRGKAVSWASEWMECVCVAFYQPLAAALSISTTTISSNSFVSFLFRSACISHIFDNAIFNRIISTKSPNANNSDGWWMWVVFIRLFYKCTRQCADMYRNGTERNETI